MTWESDRPMEFVDHAVDPTTAASEAGLPAWAGRFSIPSEVF